MRTSAAIRCKLMRIASRIPSSWFTSFFTLCFTLFCVPCPIRAQNETLATPSLQKVTEEMIQLNGVVRAPCKSLRVLKTEILKWPPDVWTDNPRLGVGPLKTWKERWHVEQCGTETAYRIEYKANLRGGIDVEIHIPGIGEPEPPPPTTLNAKLLEAAETGKLRLIEKLLAEGADVKSTNEYGRTPFIAAVAHGYNKAAKLLLEHGSDVKALEKRGASALYYAAGTGTPELVRMLLAAGADIHQKFDNGEEPLAEAAVCGNIEAAQLLLEAGADINARSRYLSTPLMEAATYGWSEMMLFLLDHGADPGLRSAAAETALHRLALGCNSPGVARVLLARGSSTKQDRTETLLKTLSRGFDDDCVALARVLLESDIDINRLDGEGNTALLLAARGGYPEIVQSLLKKGADPTVRNKQGKLALDLAASPKIADVLRKATKKR